VLIRIGHSPDPDDAFMVWAFAAGRIETPGFEVELVPADIQTLNESAGDGRLEVTALSAAAYPGVQERYRLLPHGASFGEGYGPIVVARAELTPDELRSARIAIPGRLTTAYLTLRMVLGDVACDVLPFDEILPAVAAGDAEAGLLIHEGQLTYADAGVRKCLDLGDWWSRETGLPLPLGVNTIRRDLGDEAIYELSALLRRAIGLGLEHRGEALAYAKRFGRDLDDATVDRFVAMYVNDRTVDAGEDGRNAIRELLARGEAIGAFTRPVVVDFAD
jgi:1,4-dihydroxy-6-naphthoate synthase